MNKPKFLWLQWVACFYILAALTAAAQIELPLPPPIHAHAISFWPLEVSPWQSSSDKPARAFTNLNVPRHLKGLVFALIAPVMRTGFLIFTTLRVTHSTSKRCAKTVIS
jgi:hypothetical protein